MRDGATAQVFPLIKPVSYLKGEVVFKRGEPSRDLFFLLAGEVSVLSGITGRAAMRITPTEEHCLSSSDPPEVLYTPRRPFLSPLAPSHQPSASPFLSSLVQVLYTTSHNGCFGESVLTGRRRPATHVASAWSEMLILTKPDLVALFERNPRAARRILTTLLSEVYHGHVDV